LKKVLKIVNEGIIFYTNDIQLANNVDNYVKSKLSPLRVSKKSSIIEKLPDGIALKVRCAISGVILPATTEYFTKLSSSSIITKDNEFIDNKSLLALSIQREHMNNILQRKIELSKDSSISIEDGKRLFDDMSKEVIDYSKVEQLGKEVTTM